ncbi:MAG: WD40 repeat domain-containing protein, partial [Anaerolineales bacterium]|nr:WD40 repeat domain-containing protein [Anaerolineales bacterium]
LENGHLITRAASGHNTGSLSIWNLSDGNHHTIEYPARQQSRFTLSENGRWLYGQYVVPDTNSAEILVWDLQQLSSDMAPDRVLTFEIDAASYSAVISPDQKWLAVATGWPGYHVFLYDLTKESLLPIELTAYKQEFAGIHGTYLRFSADSRWLTFGHHQVDTIPMLWDLDSENPVASGQKLDCYGGNLLGTSQDGRWLVTSNRQGATCLWDMSDPGQSLDPIFLYDQQGAAEQIAFSPDNQWLAVASEGKQVSIWQLTADNIHLSYLSLSQIELRNLTFGMDSQLLYTYSFGQLNAWPLNLGDWLGVACQIAGRNLTQQEWYRYFDTEPYRQTCP